MCSFLLSSLNLGVSVSPRASLGGRRLHLAGQPRPALPPTPPCGARGTDLTPPRPARRRLTTLPPPDDRLESTRSARPTVPNRQIPPTATPAGGVVQAAGPTHQRRTNHRRRDRARRCRPRRAGNDQPQAARSCEAPPARRTGTGPTTGGEMVRGAAGPAPPHRRRDRARRRRPDRSAPDQPPTAGPCQPPPTRPVSTGPATDRGTMPAAADPP